MFPKPRFSSAIQCHDRVPAQAPASPRAPSYPKSQESPIINRLPQVMAELFHTERNTGDFQNADTPTGTGERAGRRPATDANQLNDALCDLWSKSRQKPTTAGTGAVVTGQENGIVGGADPIFQVTKALAQSRCYPAFPVTRAMPGPSKPPVTYPSG